MYFEEYGDRNKTTVIMLHGAAMVHCFAKQLSLADRFHLIIPHIYGNGKESEEIFNKERTVKDIIGLAEGLGKENINLVGFSIGAQLIIPILCNKSELFDKAILVSPHIIRSEETLQRALKSSGKMYPLTRNRFVSKLMAKGLGLNSTQAKEFAEYNSVMKKENFIAFVKGVTNITDYPQFQEIDIPMLVIAGKDEPPETLQSVEHLKKMNHNCITEIWEGCGHNIPIKEGARFSKTIADFLNEKAYSSTH